MGRNGRGGRRRSHSHYSGPPLPAYSHQSHSGASDGEESRHEEGRGGGRRPVERCDSLDSRSDSHDRNLGVVHPSPASSSPPDDRPELLSDLEYASEEQRVSTALYLTSAKGPAVSPALLCDGSDGGGLAENGEENEDEDERKVEIESENGVPDLNGYPSQGESSLALACCGKEEVKKNPKEGDIFEEEKRGGSGLAIGDKAMKLEKGKSAMRGEEKKDGEDKGPQEKRRGFYCEGPVGKWHWYEGVNPIIERAQAHPEAWNNWQGPRYSVSVAESGSKSFSLSLCGCIHAD